MLRIPFSTIPEGWHKLTPAEHLPCPFCGGKATVHSAIDASFVPQVERWNATPSCGECGATGPSAIGTTHTESIANAWAAWDRRDGGGR
jgi:transcription elongation factor Elf1